MRIGSLCTGIGGLDLAAAHHYRAQVVWHAEYDRHASTVLETRFPGVPNHGDINALDLDDIEPVDIITAGYPCQPFSTAGLRKGQHDDRHLWPAIRDAISVLRPRIVVLENVRGHLTLGFDRVLTDLAAIGFDAEWGCFRSSDIGAPHQRARLYTVATTDPDRFPTTGDSRPVPSEETSSRRHEDIGNRSTHGRATTTDAADVGHERSRATWNGGVDLRTAIALLPTPTTQMDKPSTTSATPQSDGYQAQNSLVDAVRIANGTATGHERTGASTRPPSNDGNGSPEPPPPTPWTTEDD